MKTFICTFCSSVRKNSNSWKNHERTCPSNPDRKYKNGKTGKKGSNQFLKAIELSKEPPIISQETRKKISTNTKNAYLNRLPEKNLEIFNKISESMKKAHKEGRAWNIGKSRWNNQPSYPEKFFMDVIDNEFIDKNYKKEFSIGIYSADFCWPHLKKIIEIDGDQHQRFEEYTQRDQKKDAFVKSQGYKVLRIVWKEMFNNSKEKIKECYDFIHIND